MKASGCVVGAVHQNFRLLDGVGGGRSLLRADFVDRDKHGGIDGVCYIQERSGDALHVHDAAFFKFRCGCGVGGVLDFGTIRRCEPFVGRILGAFGDGVLGALQGFTDGVGNGDASVFF